MNVEQRAKEFCDGAFGPFGVDTAPYASIIAELIQGAVDAERERYAKCVPTNWLDPLLTGKDAPSMPLGVRAVEALLRGIQDRIRGK